MSHEHYENPLISRYASDAMSRLWGGERKFQTWRRLWIALAEAEAELSLPVSQEQIDELKAHAEDVDFEAAKRYERELRHDVMAHVHAYGDACPKARPIIHLGATSCFVTDNTDLILLREGLGMVRDRLAATIDLLGRFAAEYRDLPCLGFTHLQTGSAYDGWQTSVSLGLRLGVRSGRSRAADLCAASAEYERDNRDAGELLESFRR